VSLAEKSSSVKELSERVEALESIIQDLAQLKPIANGCVTPKSKFDCVDACIDLKTCISCCNVLQVGGKQCKASCHNKWDE